MKVCYRVLYIVQDSIELIFWFNIVGAQGIARLKTALRKHVSNVDEDGIDLLSLMLRYDPEQRVAATTARKHKFFAELEEN